MAALVTFIGFVDTAFADRIVTIDGRVLEAKKAREKDGGYVLEFEHGTIVLPDKKMVKTVEIEGDMSEYVPQNDDEKSKLAQGYVKYRGHWMPKVAYQAELEKQAAASRQRADELAAHADWSNAWSKETKHFVVNSNTSPELLDYYCELLETYYALMDDRFGINPGPELKRTKMTVNVFKNVADFRRVAKPDEPSVLGYFNRATQELNFFHSYSEPAQTEWVALHECTHLLTYLIDPQYLPQIWLNEAIADYFGSSDISRDKKGKLVVKPGALQADRLLTVQDAIKEGNDTKLDKLFDLSHDDFDGFQYAHAWAFIYFLNESNPKSKKAFDKFFEDLYTQAKGIEYQTVSVSSDFDKSGTAKQASAAEIRRVVLSYLGAKDLAVLEKQWKSWIAEVTLSGPEQIFKRAYQTVAYGRLYVIEDGKLDRDKTIENAEQALKDVDTALAAGLKDPRAYWTRFELYKLLGKPEEAKAEIVKALELDPLNARFHWAMGQSMYGDFAGESDEDAGFSVTSDAALEKPSDEAKQHFGLATELAPDNETYRSQFKKMMDG